MKRAATALAMTLALASPASAYFEDIQVGARGLALGPAAVATVTDASAYHWNPAALTRLGAPEVLVDYAKPYGLQDLNAGALVLATRAYGTSWAVAWRHLGLSGVYSEDLFAASAGRTLWQERSGHRLDGGVTFKFGRASFEPFDDPQAGGSADYGTLSRGDLDAGLLWTTPWRVDLAWVSRGLLQPRYEFVAGTGGDRIPMRQEMGAAFRWNRESTITLGWSQLDGGGSTLNAGIEILFYDVFAIRSGVSNLSRIYESYGSPNDLLYQGGIGVFHRGYHVDVAATSDRDLGASYRVTVRVPMRGAGTP